MTDLQNILNQLAESRNIYLAEAAKCLDSAAPCPEYWSGKASGLQMAIETINFVVVNQEG